MGVDENDLTVTARLNDQESIKNLVAGGLGISIISEKAAEDAVKAGRLMTFPLPDAGAHRQLYVACRRGRPGQRPDPAVHPVCQEFLSLSMCSAGETGHFLSLAP